MENSGESQINPNKSFQLVVIGGGPGGYTAAFYAADLGLRVVLVDSEPNPGGVCLYKGCIPSKAFLRIAKLLTDARNASQCGIRFPEPDIDLERLRDWKNEVVRKLTGGLGLLTKQRKIEYFKGRASFLSPSNLKIQKTDGGDEILHFDHAIIATGSRPSTLPEVSGNSTRIMDSSSALDLPDVPETLLVVGGGYIGLELGTVYASLGSQVTVAEMLPGVLPGADLDLVNILLKRLKVSFKDVLLNTTVTGMTENADNISVTLKGKEGIQKKVFTKALIAVGRKPNTDGIGLENTGVVVDSRGFIVVDPQRRTAESAIYAIGDVVGEPMLAHKASHEGRVAVDAISGKKTVFDPRAIPAVVYTDPEIAWAGLTETQAKELGVEVKTARFPWAASGRAVTLDRNDGVTKLVIDPATERILGVGICGPGASELIAEGVLAIEMAALARDLSLTIHPHPTLSEMIMEAADTFFGHSAHLFRPVKQE